MAAEFEARRPQLRAVAYRMLGSLTDADDAVQEAWLRLARADTAGVDNLGGWLTTVVGRICLDVLRTRSRHPEQSLDGHVPDPVLTRSDGRDPEGEAEIADAVGLALMVVLERLSPAERLTLVLHDTFAVPYAEIAPMLGRSVAATKQLASRARSRVRTGSTSADAGFDGRPGPGRPRPAPTGRPDVLERHPFGRLRRTGRAAASRRGAARGRRTCCPQRA